jgi:hypothetical protein
VATFSFGPARQLHVSALHSVRELRWVYHPGGCFALLGTAAQLYLSWMLSLLHVHLMAQCTNGLLDPAAVMLLLSVPTTCP